MNNYQKFLEEYPILQELKTTPQDKYYHAEGDVWTHTCMVLDALQGLPEYKNATETKQLIMFYAALFHDISKPACTVFEDDGRITSAGHSKRGAIDTRILLWENEWNFAEREAICNIINTHQVPFFAFSSKTKPGQIPRTPQFIAHSLSWQLPLDCLIAVAKADMIGRDYAEKQSCLDDIELFTELAKEENCYDQAYQFPDVNTRVKYFRSTGAIAPNYPHFSETGSVVKVMCGLPASGKSTYTAHAKKNLGLPVLSFDDAKHELGLKQSDNSGSAYQLVVGRAKEYLRKGEPFVWDATHLSMQMRNKTIDLLYSYNAQVEIVYCEVPKAEILRRNKERDTTLTNEKILTMLYKWELPTPMEANDVIYGVNGYLDTKFESLLKINN